MSNLTYIFVHGLSGWGSYDPKYRYYPYWGMRNGDFVAFLRSRGYDCYAASVAPAASAWDRACELYAQLAGKVVDYGLFHSRKYNHPRYGTDYSAKPLIPRFDETTKLVLIGHSFGGTTIRVFSQLLAQGDKDERNAGENTSPLFLGGMEDRIFSLVTLASPHNGTTAYNIFEDPSFDPSSVKSTARQRMFSGFLTKSFVHGKEEMDPRDCADYDMHIDHARAMNLRIPTLDHVYYFSWPASCTSKQSDGAWTARPEIEPLIELRANLIGSYTGITEGGFVLDESWQENDGLVNTISAWCPLPAPHDVFRDKESVRPGIWNVMPVYQGDHMVFQGGLMRRHDMRFFYLNLLSMMEQLAAS